MRDQFDDLRKQMRDSGARIRRLKLNLDWNDAEFSDMRPVAEEIWQLAYNLALTLSELQSRCAYCTWKIYRVVDLLVRNGLFALESNQAEPALAESGT
jgi:hypothetical protein